MSSIIEQQDNLRGMLKDGLISREEYEARIIKQSKKKTDNDFIRKEQFVRSQSNRKEKVLNQKVRKTENKFITFLSMLIELLF